MTTDDIELPVLDQPGDGVPPVTDTPEALELATAQLAAGTGPVSIDTERAHGFRYSAKAYLIQMRRSGGGTHLIDPVAFENGAPRADLSDLATQLSEPTWILHAATQDLPCLAEVRLLPRTLFDTELAARLLNIPRVNLGALAEAGVGVRLRKEHSAADWSKRPLPEEWLNYAALDVELLDQLMDWLIEQLQETGKTEWAEQEFAHLVAKAGHRPPPAADPWRRTSGLHAIRGPLGLGVVRALWQARDAIAAREDRAPGRILNDRAITELAAWVDAHRSLPDRMTLRAIQGFSMRRAFRHEGVWLAAVGQTLALPRTDLPPRHTDPTGVPLPRTWEARWPEAFARWHRVRPALIARAEERDLPVENLLAPDVVRRLLFEAPEAVSAEWISERTAELGARPWQRELTTEVIHQAWSA